MAGCSTGEEVYSLAICLLEYLDSHPAHRSPVQIFGTDASDSSIRTARAGIFPETLASQVSPERLRKFFVKLGKGYQISKRARDLCIFARQSLGSDPPYSQLDLVSCRNVLIYLTPRRQDQIVRTFHYALRPDGFLLLGSAETLHQHSDLFQPLDRANKLYAKIPGGERSGFETWGRFPLSDAGPPQREGEKRTNWSEGELQRAVDRMIVSRFDLLGVVVDEHMNIVFTRGRTAPFLEMASGASSLQLMRMVRSDLSGTVKDAVQRSIEEDIPIQVEALQIEDGDSARDVVIEVLPLHNAGLAMRCFLILFGPKETQRSRMAEAVPGSPEPQDRDETVGQLRRDLGATKRYIQALIEDRDIKNQELISASEEVQSQNEELQSANEELETTKEEIQSANEELQTVNDELQQRNVSLTHLGNDLTNLLSSVNLPMLMLNNELQIRQFTPAAQRIMSVRSSDIGRPISDIRVHLSLDNFEPIVREVMETLGTKEMEVQDHEQRWHLLRVRPYRTTENKIEGVVLLLIDIEDSRRAQRELRESRDFSQAIIDNVQVPLVVLNPDCRIRTANNAFLDLIKSAGNIEGRSFPDLVTAQWGMREASVHLKKLRERGAGASFYFEHDEPGPGSRSVAVRGLALQAEGEQALLLIVEDITLRKQTEEVLMRERNTLLGQVQSGERHLERTRDELRRLAAQLFTSQEQERRRVARELHDDITQRLALLGMSLDQFALEVPENTVREKLEALRHQTAALAEDVRLISHGLHPAILDDLGLPIALRVLSEEFGSREGMPATFSQQNVSSPIPHELAATMYRIAQEALRNIAKHAGKTHVKLSLEETGNALRMEIVDFGQGFDPQEVQSGLGLISMVERARLVAGVVSVRSARGKGTAVTVEIPLQPVSTPIQ